MKIVGHTDHWATASIPMEGFIAHLDYNLFSRRVDPRFAIFRKGIAEPKVIALPFGGGTLLDAMDRVDLVDMMIAGLCCDAPDMPDIEHPQKRRRLSGSVRAPEGARVWDVGVRISAAIRNFGRQRKNEQVGSREGTMPGSHASPRPHVRSAHWQTYWTGPRNAVFPDRKPVVHWIPPLPIGMSWKSELPTNVRVIS